MSEMYQSNYDILRQSNAGMLLNGNVPGISWRALLGGMLCLAILAGITWLLHAFQWIEVFLAFVTSGMLAYGAWRMAATRFRLISRSAIWMALIFETPKSRNVFEIVWQMK